MDATFRVKVMPKGRTARTYTIEAPARNDGFEGLARTRAMWAWFHDEDATDNGPLRGERVEYEVEKIKA